jgi:Arc/MetJ family transcription regulator
VVKLPETGDSEPRHGKEASNDAICRAWQEPFSMRTTLTLDDEMLAIAQELTNIEEKSALVREALKALIERESARRLARLGGTSPRLKAPPRRRFGK